MLSVVSRCYKLLLAAAILVAATGGNAALSADVSTYEKTLSDRGIAPNADGISDYLRQLHPSAELRAKALALIEDLSNDSFATREAAMQQLLIMPVLDTEAVVAATRSNDPEVRWRAEKVLTVGRPETERLLYAAFRVIKEEKLAEAVPSVIAAIPLCDRKHIRVAAQDALVAAARPEDLAHLTSAAQSDNAFVRAAAASALGEALGKDADEHLRRLTTDESDLVRMAAARAMANYGERDALATLVKLLDSEDVEVRTQASGTLRSLTDQFFGFAAYDEDERRRKAVQQWQTWLADSGPTAELNFPLRPWGYGVSFLNGNTLLAYGNRHKVVELDPAGKEVWSYNINGAWSAEKMANGNVLIASNSTSRVVEVDPEGKVVWEYNTPNPLNAKPLPNGNVLIAAFTQRKVIEVSRDKKVVWEHRESQYVSDAHRLENGNTLIACMNGAVKEISPEKKVLWEYDGLNQAYGCQPLPNGNVLIASLRGDVHEVDRDKQVVWKHKEQNAADVFRLPNGNTLITGSRRFVEVTPDNKVVWEKSGNQYGSARR